jgi:hypothetical protein
MIGVVISILLYDSLLTVDCKTLNWEVNSEIQQSGIPTISVLDTGAFISSINGTYEIVESPITERPILNLSLHMNGQRFSTMTPLTKYYNISAFNGEPKKLPATILTVSFGGIFTAGEFVVTEHTGSEHDVIIGRNILRNQCVRVAVD